MMQHGGVVYDYAKILNLKQFTTEKGFIFQML